MGLGLITACGAGEPKPTTPAPIVSAAPTASATPAKAPTANAPTPPPPKGIELASLDPSAAPCDDFFQYACGGWIKSHPIPDDQSAWSRFSEINESNELALREILERDAAKPGATDPFEKELGNFYASCMDEKAIEKADTRALAPYLARIDAVTDPASLARAVAALHAIGAAPFFELSSEQDLKDATLMIAGIEQAGLGLPERDYYLNDDAKTVDIRKKYQAHVERMLTLLGTPAAAAKADAESIVRTEHALAEASISKTDHRDPYKVYHRLEIDGLRKVAPTFPWDVYLKERGFPGIAQIDVSEPDFMAAVEKLVAASGKGPASAMAKDIRPYLRWHLVRAFAEQLPARFVDEAFSFRRELLGTAKILPRWKRCVHAVDEGMGMALSQPFVRARLGAAGKETTQGMVTAIEAAMKEDLTHLTWMDDPTRARALEKLQKIANTIGYPDKWRRYDGLAIDRASYAGNMMRAATFEAKRMLAKIGKPVDRTDWLMTPSTVNAYYNPSLNQMVFAAGILQPPFFSTSAPPGVSFGAIGMVMGHELTHGFDDTGRQFDGDGNLKDWWTAPIAGEFDKRAACVEKQFADYVSVDDLHLNGKLTLGENIADLGGLKVAHEAFVRSRSAGDSDAAAGDRQFFLGYAQSWCSSQRDELKRMLVRVDPHSPARFRVNGPLSNAPEFAKAFGCGDGAKMVRANRCEVW
jgi:endothelin-converting enzyme/putative endopeptidase